MQQIIVFLFSGVIIIILGFSIFLLIHFLNFKKKFDILFAGKKIKDLEDVLLDQLQKTKKQEKEIIEIFEKIKKLEGVSQKTFQKIGVVRFNPFNDVGGNQSFAIALLDDRNNGFVISSIFSRDGNRVYAKPVDSGASTYSLSDEEKAAIEKAIGPK